MEAADEPAPLPMSREFYAEVFGAEPPSWPTVDAIPARWQEWALEANQAPGRPGYSASRVEYEVAFPDDGVTARRLLTESWGEPIVQTDVHHRTLLFWRNKAGSVRALLAAVSPEDARPTECITARCSAEVYIGEFMPLETFIDPTKQQFGFERIPLLGASKREFLRAYGDGAIPLLDPETAIKDYDYFEFELPANEHDSGEIRFGSVAVDTTGRVVAVAVAIDVMLSDAGRRRAIELLEQKFGMKLAGNPLTFRSNNLSVIESEPGVFQCEIRQ